MLKTIDVSKDLQTWSPRNVREKTAAPLFKTRTIEMSSFKILLIPLKLMAENGTLKSPCGLYRAGFALEQNLMYLSHIPKLNGFLHCEDTKWLTCAYIIFTGLKALSYYVFSS